MSGRGCRARRTAAVKRAKEDVYHSRGAEIETNPFTDPRCARIYEAYYQRWRDHYWEMEAEMADLADAYRSFGPTPAYDLWPRANQ